MVVFKYVLDLGVTTIDLPRKAKVLTTQVQDDKVCIWVLLNPNDLTVTREFHVIGTGHLLPDNLMYIGTIQLLAGKFIGHVFERIPF